jgi:hypothetical protein
VLHSMCLDSEKEDRSGHSLSSKRQQLGDDLPCPRIGKLGGRRRGDVDQFERLEPPIQREADELEVVLALAENPSAGSTGVPGRGERGAIDRSMAKSMVGQPQSQRPTTIAWSTCRRYSAAPWNSVGSVSRRSVARSTWVRGRACNGPTLIVGPGADGRPQGGP